MTTIRRPWRAGTAVFLVEMDMNDPDGQSITLIRPILVHYVREGRRVQVMQAFHYGKRVSTQFYWHFMGDLQRLAARMHMKEDIRGLSNYHYKWDHPRETWGT